MDGHYHISTSDELTICTPGDAPIHLDGIITNASIPSVAGIRISREVNGPLTIITVDHPETETTTIRYLECDDPFCEKGLQDFWL